jgi:hypothetical protein
MTARRDLWRRAREHRADATVLVGFALLSLSSVAKFFADGTLPLEYNDEPVHTFTVIPQVWEALRRGVLLEWNPYDNFGIPVLGDPVTRPLAPQALAYVLFEPWIGALVVRVVVLFLTLSTLFAYWRRRMSSWPAALASFLAVSAPGFLHFLHHHPHQMIQCGYAAVLLAVEACADEPTRTRRAWVFAASLLLFASTGTNAAIVSVPFLMAHLFVRYEPAARARVLTAVGPSLAAGLLLSGPGYLAFAMWAGVAGRSEIHLTTLMTSLSDYDWPQLLFRVAWLVVPWGYHTDRVVHLSPFVLAFAGMGIVAIRRSPDRRPAREWIVLGITPFVLVMLLLRYRGVYDAIPFVRSMDVSRFLWLAVVYLGGAAATGAAAFPELSRQRGAWLALAAAALVTWGTFPLHPAIVRRPVEVGLVAAGCVLAGTAWVVSRRVALHPVRWTIGIVGLLVVGPRLDTFWFMTNLLYADDGRFAWPKSFLSSVEPDTRLSSVLPQIPTGFDARAGAFHVLGTGGRSIILHGALRNFFEARLPLVTDIRRLSYALPILEPSLASLVGIRHLVVPEDGVGAAESFGWIPIVEDKGLHLLRNPDEPTPVYVAGSTPRFLPTYEIGDDRISVRVEADVPRPCTVVATFTAWPGWTATVDGHTVPVPPPAPDSLPFLEAPCPSDAGDVVFTFEPVSAAQYAGFWACAALLLGLGLRRGSMLESRGAGPKAETEVA